MDQLTSLGLILLLALLAGHLVRVLRMPAVTGYILAGVALGPSMLGWLTRENLLGMSVIGEVALGLILFSVGSVFEFAVFKRIGRPVMILTAAESLLAASVVAAAAFALGQPWQVSLLLGTVGMATAPASTLMVIRECNSSGPLTDHVLGIIAINNLVCLTAYSLVAASIDMAVGLSGSGHVLDTLYRSIFMLVWQLVGSIALGFLVGLLLAAWSTQIDEGGEMLILLAGSILLTVGLARVLELSTLVASLAVGATMVNVAKRTRPVFETLSGTDPPFYAIFFVIAGAELDVSLVPAMGLLGFLYVLGRAGGKLVGATLAAMRLGLAHSLRRYLGLALLTQAGLAVGLALAINQRFPDLAPVVTTVVLASVTIFEVIGPISVRFALVSAGEATRHHAGGPPLVPDLKQETP